MTCSEPQIVALDHESAIGRAALIDLEVDLDRLEVVTDVTGHGWRISETSFFRVHQLCVLAQLQLRVEGVKRQKMSVIRRSRVRRTSCGSLPTGAGAILPLRRAARVSTALRSEVSGFFKFVAYVGGEALDGFDAGIRRVGHFAKRGNRQIADLILSVGENPGFPPGS